MRKALKEIGERIEIITRDYKDDIPEYFRALFVAKSAIEAQLRLEEMLHFVDSTDECRTEVEMMLRSLYIGDKFKEDRWK